MTGVGRRSRSLFVSDRANVLTLGADGSGQSDASSAIRSRLTSIAAGGEVYLPAGTYRAENLDLPANCWFHGAGVGATKLVSASRNVPVLKVTGKTNVNVSDMSIITLNDADGLAGSRGIEITGASDEVALNRLYISRFGRNVNIDGANATMGRVYVTAVKAYRASNEYNFNCEQVQSVSFDTCGGEQAWFDCFKLTRDCKYLKFRNCWAKSNGRSGNGQGIDGYSDSDTITVDGFEAVGNAGGGLLFKTGPDFAPSYIKRLMLNNIIAEYNTGGSGLYLNINDQGDLTQQLPTEVSINNANLNYNAEDGFYCLGFAVRGYGITSIRNERNGIYFPARAFDCRLYAPFVAGNGPAAGTTGRGIAIGGTNIIVDEPIIYGTYTENITAAADLANVALRKYHQYNLDVHPTADKITVRAMRQAYANAAGTLNSSAGTVTITEHN